ncbi:unnamed protein product [Blepharisma stoltei]|uniref:C2H2-type domain-containing protein n=1 Tax=Blepharisma stoltei TaxID=1481888 RepID=A0AAU9JLB0_9CILI|nr:unnamed protein product [Blepharisma stoltei]
MWLLQDQSISCEWLEKWIAWNQIDYEDYFIDIDLAIIPSWVHISFYQHSRNILMVSWNGNQIRVKQKTPEAVRYNQIFEFWYSSLIEIRNLIFDGQNFITCSNSEYCYYCPYVFSNSDSSKHYNDRHEEISEYLSSPFCEYQGEYYWFLIINSNLTLTNVTFQNFRFGFKSLMDIGCNSNLTLAM